ncbi:MAG: aldo/keto reductase [Deltaproteobacteria bacterium]|nr:aldo/keto reductase [Deltaproteobacteria bacterium]MBT4644857.1 aldo/keto reductase [Deltaproteobacteria bacterium]MBT6499514.1 aldo/keto reductase [Deltaproteobacteria bacterium]MBT7156055.1 aldo/keto reductase [Deltaproteobacteria bacterium]MBT7713746.1 aldo/keto reductase [Deltaproteobacteria bacterium]
MKKKPISRRRFIKSAAVSAAGLGLIESLDLISPLAAATSRQNTGTLQLPHRMLGSTGVQLPILQLGTSQSLSSVYDRILHRSYREGISVLDTALSYGRGSSHRAIAKFTAQIGDRSRLWITSKSDAWGINGLIADADKCLDQLKTDYLDLYLMHGVDSTSYLEPEYIRAGEQLRKSGKIRFFGFSTHGGDLIPMMNKAVKTGGIDAILFRYNFRRYGESELNRALDACKEAGIGLIAMKTMGGVSSENEKVVRFRSRNFSLAQAKLKSVWMDDRIDAVVSEMQNVGEVRENAAAARSGTDLSFKEQKQLQQLAARTSHLYCLGCSQLCEGATEAETPIADTLRYLMYHECYGKTEHARQLYRELPETVKRFEKSELEAATRVCPQGIDIANRLRIAREVLENGRT